VNIFAEEHAGHASKVLHTFLARNGVLGIFHVATNAWPIALRSVLPAKILARNLAFIVVAVFSAEAYVRLAWQNVNGSASIILVISSAMKHAPGLVATNRAKKI
jgi:hypothetical protein